MFALHAHTKSSGIGLVMVSLLKLLSLFCVVLCCVVETLTHIRMSLCTGTGLCFEKMDWNSLNTRLGGLDWKGM